MINRVAIREGTLLSEILLPEEIDLSQKVNLLFGSNGVGKSTLIKALIQKDYRGELITELDGNPPLVFSYINSEQNAREMERNSHFSYKDMFDPFILSRKYDATELSEGQSIIYTIQELLICANEDKEGESYLFVMDEIDSGLSVDNTIWLCDEIKKIVKNRDNIQFIIAFNNYEFCNQFETVVSMYSGEQIKIKNYEEYKSILLGNREKLLVKRNYNQFRNLKVGD